MKNRIRVVSILVIASVVAGGLLSWCSKLTTQEKISPAVAEVTATPTQTLVVTPTLTQTPKSTKKPTKKPVKTAIAVTKETKTWRSKGKFTLTAYCSCKKCCGKWAKNRPVDENGNTIVITASGKRAKAGTTIAVDPKVIPYGTKVKINGHIYIAQDTGVRGKHIDVYFDSHEEAVKFGKKKAIVYIKGK